MRVAALGLACAVSSACSGGDKPPGPRPIGDPHAEPEPALVAPGLRLPGGVEPIGYRLALDLDPAADTFHGQVEIKLMFDAPADHVWLHAVDLELGAIEVEVGGRARDGMLAPITGDEMIAIELGGTAPAGMVTLRIKYEGRYHDRDQLGLFRHGDPGRRYIYSQLEAVQARKVVPCLDEPRFKVPWLVTLDVPAGMSAFSNAPVADVVDHGADGQTVHFAPTEPLPSYLVAFAVGPFAVLELGTVGANRTPLRVIAPAGTKPGAAAWARTATPRIVDRLEAYFGRPLPYPKLDLVAVPDFPGAMENPGLITFDLDLLLIAPEPAQRIAYVEIAAHELAHQWFGNLVTLAWWDDLWLNESFATWMAAKVAAELAPARDDAAAIRTEIETAMTADVSPTAAALRRDIRTNADIEGSFDAIAYEKGAAVIAMFEAWIGEAALRRAITGYLDAHAGGVTDSAGFLDAIERVSDAGVRRAFASFVDQPGVPVVTFERTCDGGPPRIAVSQERLVAIGSAVPVTTWRVPVCVRFPLTGKPPAIATPGRETPGCVMLDGPRAEITLPDTPCPAWIVGNAGDQGYYRVRVDPGLIPPVSALAPRERLGVGGGIAALIDAGKGDPAAVAAIVPDLLATGLARDETAALELVRSTRDLVPEARRGAWQRWARGLLAGALVRARLDGKPPTELARRRSRVERIRFAAIELEDPRVLADARARATRWLDGKLALSGDELALVLTIAAHGADRPFADRLLARASTMTAGDDRSAVLAALGEVVDGDVALAALAALVDPGFPSGHDIAPILGGLASRPATRALVVALYRDEDQLASVVAKLPAGVAALAIIAPFAVICDADERDSAVVLLAPLAKHRDGWDRWLTDTVDTIDRCIARRAALGVQLERLLGP